MACKHLTSRNRPGTEAQVLEGTDDLTLTAVSVTSQARSLRREWKHRLKNIRAGDRIDLEEPGRIETYVVERVEIVDSENVSVMRSSSKPALTLVTCYPFYFIGAAPRRFIVHAVPIDSE